MRKLGNTWNCHDWLRKGQTKQSYFEKRHFVLNSFFLPSVSNFVQFVCFQPMKNFKDLKGTKSIHTDLLLRSGVGWAGLPANYRSNNPKGKHVGFNCDMTMMLRSHMQQLQPT